MSGRRARPTDTQLVAEILEHLRLARSRRKGHTESKTFIVGGEDVEITILTVIPKFRVGIDHDGETPEWKRLTGFAASLESGTATIRWTLNGSFVGDPMALTTTENVQDLDPQLDLVHGDQVKIEITATSSAFGLSATAYMVTAAR